MYKGAKNVYGLASRWKTVKKETVKKGSGRKDGLRNQQYGKEEQG